jgi:hypothetical protein
MESLKPVAEVADVAVKVVIAVILFFLYGTAQKQAEISKTTAEATKVLAEAQKSKQETNLIVLEKLLTLFSDVHKDCLTEDRSFFINYLVEINNEYNKVQIDLTRLGVILGAQRTCTRASGKPDENARVVQEQNKGEIPFVDKSTIRAVQGLLLQAGIQAAPTPGGGEAPNGYAAIGIFDSSNLTFQNFEVLSGTAKVDGSVSKGTVLKSRWAVYLRANTENTTSGGNPILGLIKEGGCVESLESFPNTRGQTWAAVRLVDCS